MSKEVVVSNRFPAAAQDLALDLRNLVTFDARRRKHQQPPEGPLDVS
jgi:hypothetical protein